MQFLTLQPDCIVWLRCQRQLLIHAIPQTQFLYPLMGQQILHWDLLDHITTFAPCQAIVHWARNWLSMSPAPPLRLLSQLPPGPPLLPLPLQWPLLQRTHQQLPPHQRQHPHLQLQPKLILLEATWAGMFLLLVAQMLIKLGLMANPSKLEILLVSTKTYPEFVYHFLSGYQLIFIIIFIYNYLINDPIILTIVH